MKEYQTMMIETEKKIKALFDVNTDAMDDAQFRSWVASFETANREHDLLTKVAATSFANNLKMVQS